MSSTLKSNGNLQSQFQLLAKSACETSARLERGQAEKPITTAIEQFQRPDQEPLLQVSLLTLDPKSQETVLSCLDGSWKHVQLTRAESIKHLQEDPGAYQKFCTHGHVLMVVGNMKYELTEAAVAILGNLAENFEVVWPTVVESISNPDKHGWWTHSPLVSHAGLLAPLFVSSEADSNRYDVLTDESSPLRCALLFERQVRTLKGALLNLADRQQRELNALDIRQQLLEKQAKAINPRQAVINEKEIVQIREQFAEQLTDIEKQICLKSDRAIQPLGKLTNLMRQNVSHLRIEDLDKQESATLLKLSVNGRHLAAINRTVEHVLREELTADVDNISNCLQQSNQEASNRMSNALGGPVTLSTAPLLESSIWRTVENLMAIGKESHIELARKGIFDMLTAGRQKVFILIMFVSLMGRMGLPNLFQTGLMRTGFGLFMAAVLIGSMINAVFVWRREKESQSEKEMTKIKDTLFSDGSKVIEQVEKAKISFVRDYLRKVGKDFEKQLKLSAEEQSGHRKTEQDEEAQRRDTHRKKLETQIKSATELGRQITKFTTEVSSLHVSSANAIRDAVRLHESTLSAEPTPLESPSIATDRDTGSPSPPGSTQNASLEELPVVKSPKLVASPVEADRDILAQQEEPKKKPPARRTSALEQRRTARRLAKEQKSTL